MRRRYADRGAAPVPIGALPRSLSGRCPQAHRLQPEQLDSNALRNPRVEPSSPQTFEPSYQSTIRHQPFPSQRCDEGTHLLADDIRFHLLRRGVRWERSPTVLKQC